MFQFLLHSHLLELIQFEKYNFSMLCNVTLEAVNSLFMIIEPATP